MTVFMKDEFKRLVTKIPETDPTTPGYTYLLQGIEILNSMGPTIEEILAMIDEEEQPHLCDGDCAGCDQCENDGENSQEKCENSPETPPEKCEDNVVPFPVPEESPYPDEPEESKAEEVEQPTTEPAQVSVDTPSVVYTLEQVRAALVQARRSKGLNLTEFFRSFGYSNMTDLPPDLYPKAMAKLEAM